MKKLFVLCFVVLLLQGCTEYEADFLVNCEKVNDETVKCDIMGVPYLADFPVKEEFLQMKARVKYCEGNSHGSLYIFYGGNWERKNIHKDDAWKLYENSRKSDAIMSHSMDKVLPKREPSDDAPATNNMEEILSSIKERTSRGVVTTTMPVSDWRDTL